MQAKMSKSRILNDMDAVPAVVLALEQNFSHFIRNKMELTPMMPLK